MSGVNTLMSQSYGAQNYPRVGHILQRAVAICTVSMKSTLFSVKVTTFD